MGSTERRERERSDVRRRILDAARELFVAEGYEAVTMRKVADRIEYTPPAIYFHFKDKQELIEAICDEDFAALAEALMLLEDVKDPWDRLAKTGKAYVDFAVKNPNQYRIMFMTKLPAPTPDEEKTKPASAAYQLVLHLAGEAIAAGRMKRAYHDPDLVAQLLWAAMHGVASLAITMCDAHDIHLRDTNVLADSMIDTLMNGMAAEAPSSGKEPAKRPAAKTKARG